MDEPVLRIIECDKTETSWMKYLLKRCHVDRIESVYPSDEVIGWDEIRFCATDAQMLKFIHTIRNTLNQSDRIYLKKIAG